MSVQGAYGGARSLQEVVARRHGRRRNRPGPPGTAADAGRRGRPYHAGTVTSPKASRTLTLWTGDSGRRLATDLRLNLIPYPGTTTVEGLNSVYWLARR